LWFENLKPQTANCKPQTKNHRNMIRNYLKVAWRNLLRNKGLSFINIFGLSVGMAFVLVIGIWVKYEHNYDRFHSNIDRIAQVRKHTLFNNEKNTQVAVMLPLYDELRTNYPEVKRVSRAQPFNNRSLVVGEKKLSKNGFYVDPDFLRIFSFPVIKGDKETALNDPNSIVLTQSLAKTLFGKEDPINKIIRYDNTYNLKVTAVVKDCPDNSSIHFEFLAPFEFRVNNFPGVKEARTRWGNNFVMTVVEMKEGASMAALSKKIEHLIVQKDPKETNQTLFLHPLSKWHLYDEFKNWVNTGGRIEFVRLFTIVGIFVLLIACINFMNLATARSEKRAREVGVRKAIGSPRTQLIFQFLSESMLTAFIAFLISLGLIQVLLPILRDLGFYNISFDMSDAGLLISIFAVCIITGLVAGSYPAIYLSSFMPVKILKGRISQGKGATIFRKTLVVSQFIISIALITGTIIVFQQVKHATSRSIGYDPNNLVTLPGSNELRKNYTAMKQELLNTGLIEAVSKASSPMTGIYNTWDGFSWEGQEKRSDIGFDVIMTEYDYEKTSGMKFVAGRPFSREYKTDSNGMIINQAALRLMGFENPLGKTVKIDDESFAIIGVIENMVMNDPFKPVSPAVMLFRPNNAGNFFIRLKKDASPQKALAAIQPIVERHNPSLPFEYKFTDEEFGKKFRLEKQVAGLSGIFAGLAIFISCLGLLGLAAFMAERRTKEIGIRKVLGASVSRIWILLSREFVLLVLIASVIASPITYWQMSNWLQKYDYRIDISSWVFLLAGILALVIALVTVSTQAIKAALANPVKSLRTE
jgi:putative ABC transport system permease protein